ncbi:hypothetical protein PO909_020500 [Leuciscus waleckii]
MTRKPSIDFNVSEDMRAGSFPMPYQQSCAKSGQMSRDHSTPDRDESVREKDMGCSAYQTQNIAKSLHASYVKEARQRLEQIVSDICRDENTWHVARRLPQRKESLTKGGNHSMGLCVEVEEGNPSLHEIVGGRMNEEKQHRIEGETVRKKGNHFGLSQSKYVSH